MIETYKNISTNTTKLSTHMSQ